MSNLILSIDSGNTKTSFAVVDKTNWQVLGKTEIATKRLNELPEILLDLKLNYFSKISIPAIFCSVVSDYNIRKELHKIGIEDVKDVSEKNNPFSICYQPVSSLGKDRIADALFAYYFYKAQNVIIIDCGSAVTIDYLSESKGFEGGYILPGVKMQLSALFNETAKLPKINFPDCTLRKIPSCTSDAITQGVLRAVSGGINDSVKAIKAESPVDAIITSGGGWKFISCFLDFKYEYFPNMTTIGAALYSEYSNK